MNLVISMIKKIKSFDNTNINYEINKRSKTFLVFIHGVGGSYPAFREIIDFFNDKGISTLAIDLRGHGLSDRPRLLKHYDLDSFAKDIYLVLEKEKIKDFIVFGHSFGSIVTLNFQKKYPNLAKSYVLVSSMYESPKKVERFNNNFLIKIARFILERFHIRKKNFKTIDARKFYGTKDISLRRLYSDITTTTLKSWLFTYKHFSDFNGEGALKSINGPVLVVHGDSDFYVNVSTATKIKDMIKDAKLKIMPGANHVIHLNDPIGLAKIIFNFLEKTKLIKK